MSITDYTISGILNFNFGTTAFAPPATLYFGLSKTTMTESMTSTASITEVTGTSYQRKSFTNNKSNWSTSTAGTLNNTIALEFAKSGGVWSTTASPIKSIFITNSSSGGTSTIWWYANLAADLVVPTNTTVSFPAGSIVISESGVTATTTSINRILNYYFGSTSYTSPATIYFGLSTTEITSSGTVTEPSGMAYARVSKANTTSGGGSATWHTSTTGGSIHNDVDVAFPAASAAWGTIRSIFIADASSGGNILWYENFVNPLYVQSGTAVTFPAATGIVISMV